jgi:two-component system sensor histidine kinase/response regulator
MTFKNKGKELHVKSFMLKCLITADEIYMTEPSPQMYEFFGTTEESYKGGVLARIRKDIGDESADALLEVCREKSSRGEDFRLVYPSMRADGSSCVIQMDAYAGEETKDGRIYSIIDIDITDELETRKKADELAAENNALLNDSPVGLGIYHIKDGKFDLIYTNSEYYKVHHGSKEFWDKFKGKDALARILPEDRHVIVDEWKETLDDPDNHVFSAKYRCCCENGEIHWVHLLGRIAGTKRDGTKVCYASYLNIDGEKKAEEQSRSLFETIGSLPTTSVLYLEGEDGSFIPEKYSDDFCRLKGCTQDNIREFNSSNGFDPVHPDDREMVRSNVTANKDHAKVYNVVYRINTKDRGYVWVSSNYTHFEMNGKKYLYVVYTDIDDIKKQEEKLAGEYMTSQAFMDSITNVYLATMRANLTQNEIETINGKDPLVTIGDARSYDDALEMIISSMPREEDRIEFRRLHTRDALIKAYESGQKTAAAEYCFRDKNNHARWAYSKMALVRRPGSKDIIAFVNVEDTTRNRFIETYMDVALTKRYDFLASIDVLNNSIGIICVNRENTPANVSLAENDYDGGMRAYAEKYVAEEEKKAYIEFMTLENVLKDLDENRPHSASFNVKEGHGVRNKRLDFYYIDRDAKILALARIDCTDMQKERLDTEEKMRTALDAAKQASLAKSSFLSRMSHEIRTPMNAIIGMDTLAAQAIGDDERVMNCISKIGISARYLLSLINDILDMSRIESGKMLLKNEKFLFHDLISGINTMIYNQADAKGLDYECIVDNEVSEAYIGDAMKLQQVLINVLGNAVKFTKQGKVSLEVQQISKVGKNAKLRFIINDTGCGISEENQARIFDPFEQADTSTTTVFGGTGLGLAITKNLVNLMGGTIHLRSILGVGSEFTIELPIVEDDSVLLQPKLTYNFEKLHTLVVDDDVLVCEQTQSVLNDIGMIGEWVASGHEAIERVGDCAKKKFFYDFILIDWKMPDMDGIETTRNIRKIVGPDVTIIIISAYDWEAIEVEAKAAGANMLISKPLFRSTLISAFQKAQGQSAEKETAKKINFDFTGKRVLLAEDNQINAEIAKSLLESKNFIVDVAPNGLKAMEMFTKSPVGYYSAILMDVRMPMMDGLQATSNIRHWDKPDAKTIPIIAMTANAFDEDIEKSRAAGMNAHLSKPIDPELMYRTLYRFVCSKEEK